MQGSHILKKLIEENPAIVAGDGRTLGTQALMQVSQYQLLSLTKEIYFIETIITIYLVWEGNPLHAVQKSRRTIKYNSHKEILHTNLVSK